MTSSQIVKQLYKDFCLTMPWIMMVLTLILTHPSILGADCCANQLKLVTLSGTASTHVFVMCLYLTLVTHTSLWKICPMHWKTKSTFMGQSCMIQ